jgi:O-antigen ligase
MAIGAHILPANSTISAAPPLLVGSIGFFFSFRVFDVLVPVRFLHMDATTGVVLGLGLNYLLFGLVLFSSVGDAERSLGSVLRLPCARWALCFAGFAGCSLLWTVAVSTAAAAAFWCGMAADLAIVLLLVRLGPVPVVASALAKGFVLGACAVAIISWGLPAQSDLRLGDEELVGPNAIGYTCALAIFFAEYLIRVCREKGIWKVALVLVALTLVRSLSKTSIAAIAVSHAAMLVTDKSLQRRTKVLILLGTLMGSLVFAGLFASYWTVYTGNNGQAETLTGRTGIWLYIFIESLERPWIGHGFHSVWKVIPPFYADHFEARHAHNELLQQFYAYGTAGILMLIGYYRSFYQRLRGLFPSPLRSILLGLLIFSLIRGLTDTEVFDLTLPLWALVLFSAVIESVPAEHQDSYLAGASRL